KRMLTVHVANGVAQIIIVLGNRNALPVAPDIKTRGTRALPAQNRAVRERDHLDIRKRIIECRRGHADTRKAEGTRDTSGTGRRIREINIRIILTKLSGQTVKTDYGLVEEMIIESVRVR